MAEKFLNVAKRLKPTDSTCWVYLKQYKLKEMHTEKYSQTVKDWKKKKDKNLESSQLSRCQSWHLTYRRKTVHITDFSSETMEARRKRHKFFSSAEENPESYMQWKYPSGMKGKQIFSAEEKLRDFVASRLTLKECLKQVL